MFQRFNFLPGILLLVSILIIAGCSGSGDSPVMPNPDDTTLEVMHPDDILTQSWDSPGLLYMWGLYDISYNSEDGFLKIVPLRGPQLTVNVNTFLQPPGGDAANLAITIIDASTFKTAGNIDIDVSITHPFAGMNKFHGFDVMGVFMTNGAHGGVMDINIRYPKTLINGYLKNPDGYTRWMNSFEFSDSGLLGYTKGVKGFPSTYCPTNSINGFKYFADGLGAEDDIETFYQTQTNVDKRGIFLAGSTLTRRYELKFPAPGAAVVVNYQYSILASWAKPDPGSLPDPDPSDFPADANLQEPFYVEITDNGSTLYYVNDVDNGGNLSLNLEIFDWQGAANPFGVPGEISHIWIEDVDGAVIPGGYTDMLPTATASAGKANSSVFSVDVIGCTPTGTGRQDFLITIESADPTTYDQGFGTVYPSGADLATYRRYTANVATSNPCPTPNVTGPTGTIVNINDLLPAYGITGNGFVTGTQLALELQRSSGDIAATNVIVNDPGSAQGDFDFTGATAGMYDLYFMNGCGQSAPLVPANQVEVNTPPTSTGITGPASGDGNLGVQQYNANASDADTDPIDTLTYSWTVTHQPSGVQVLGPVSGDPLSVDFSVLSVALFDIDCTVSDGYVPADLNINTQITKNNTQPTIGTPTGPTPAWYTLDIHTYNVAATEIDPGQTLTYMWSVVPQTNLPSYVNPGDPTPGDFTIDYDVLLPAAGFYDIACEVDDGSGTPNAKAQSGIMTIFVAESPYTSQIPPNAFNQIIVQGTPSLQGIAGCPSFWDGFYGPIGGWPFVHPDISIIGGPSTALPTEMVIADELGVIVGALPGGIMGFAHFATPYVSGNPPLWSWLTTGLFPAGPDMIPSAVHFDGASGSDMLITNSQLTNKLAATLTPDPAAFQHYIGGGPVVNDLYTSMAGAMSPDVAVDTSNGFDMGSPLTPMAPPIYGLYTQDVGGILQSCGGPAPGPLAANPVHLMMFPSGGAQPVGTAVDAPGSVAVVAPVGAAFVGPGVGMFNIAPGAPCPSGNIIFPEPYYALAIDDDPADNLFPSNLPQPIGNWVIAATIDADRDVEIYEIDFGAPSPGPAALMPLMTIPMGTFMGGTPTAYPLDCEFISNWTGFGGTLKPVWGEELLAVLVSETVGGVWHVEIYELGSGTPQFLSSTMPVPVPPGMFPVPGASYRLDIDENNGDIYVLHEDTLGTSSITVTIISY